MTYAEILNANAILQKQFEPSSKYSISVLSNVIVAQQKEILEFYLRKEGINAFVELGDYDNILQESVNIQADAVMIFWEASNIIEGFSYKVEILSEETLKEILQKIKSEILMVFKNISSIPLVICNSFSSLPFSDGNLHVTQFDKICRELNAFLEINAPSNVIIADINKVYVQVSLGRCIDWRYWYSSKAPYTVEFFKAYAELVKPAYMSIRGKAKKALFLDCDNTLWKGVIGEDGMEGITLSSHMKGGAVFEEIQSRIVSLAKRGVIIGLATKNNLQDVEEVLISHPDMILRNENITLKKINWEEKPANIRLMVKELNIGMDSCVFLDDSDFEVGFMKEQLPEIETFQVPGKSHQYPCLLRAIEKLFFTINVSPEDLARTEMYKSEQKRTVEKSTFASVEDYLESLDLCMTMYVDSENLISRLAQMSQKTNQFNLTTKRYTDSEIQRFIKLENFKVIAFALKDKFGDSGITGMCILELRDNRVIVDSLLMSCRVLGRNVEKAFVDQIIEIGKKLKLTFIESSYYKTLKNSQVADFYEKMSFQKTMEDDKHSEYELRIDNYIPNDINYIKIEYGK